MPSNSIGEKFCVTSFGESHGAGIGVIIDGVPAGINLDEVFIQSRLDKRKPGSSDSVSPRKEQDRFDFLSGVFEGKSTGAPLCIWITNKDAKPTDYDNLKDVFRPSHADFTYSQKYGVRDHKGGGRSSARVTSAWVAAGAVAELMLAHTSMKVYSYVKQIYIHTINPQTTLLQIQQMDNKLNCPDAEAAQLMQLAIYNAIETKDSLGGVVSTQIENVPVGLGEPVFNKFQAKLAQYIFSLNAVKGLQFGKGFQLVEHKGSEVNDAWQMVDGMFKTKTNYSGGLQGGISNGMPIYFETAFKPTATIGVLQETVNSAGKEVQLEAKGRHDPCVVPRAVPIVTALTWLALADLYLLHKTNTLSQISL